MLHTWISISYFIITAKFYLNVHLIISIQLADSIKAWILFECGDKTSTVYQLSNELKTWAGFEKEIIIWQTTAANFVFDHLVRHCCGNLAFRLEQILKGKNANQLSTI